MKLEIFIFSIYFFIKVTYTFTFLKFDPAEESHDRRHSLIVTCNGSAKTDNVNLFFHYNNKNYSIPRINNVPGIYIGNLSVVSPEQSKVMVICVDQNSGAMIGAKLYLFGYPPSVISKHFPVDLKCRDYNFDRVICCVNPNISAIERLLGFEENKNGGFHAQLFFSDSYNNELSVNNSCYQLKDYIAGPTIMLDLTISNVLGNVTYHYIFDRYKIQKPNEPKVFIEQKTSIGFSFFVDLKDFGEYFVEIKCTSFSPIHMSKTLAFKFIGIKSETETFRDWPQNSELSCLLRAKVWFGNVTIGQYSDSSSVILKLMEGIPSKGPAVSPLYVEYLFIEDDELKTVVIYFINVPLIDRNGVITKFMWKCDNCFINGLNMSGSPQTISADVRQFKLNSIRINSLVYVTACTFLGCSPSWSTLKIKKLKDEIPDRELSIISNSNNLTLIWDSRRDANSTILACLYFQNNECMSIKNISLRGLSDGLKYFKVKHDQKWKFSLISSHEYKLKWVSCKYRSLSIYEVKEKIKELPHQEYVNWNMLCSLKSCSIEAMINIPNCLTFDDLYIQAVDITYNSDNGIKYAKKLINSSNTVNFAFMDMFSPGMRTYAMNVSVHSMQGDVILWFSTQRTTNFWNVGYVILVVILIVIVLLSLASIIWMFKTRIKKDYFKNKFSPKKLDLTTRHYSVTPVKLLNTNKTDYLTEVSLDEKQKYGYFNHLKDKDSILSTPSKIFGDNINFDGDSRSNGDPCKADTDGTQSTSVDHSSGNTDSIDDDNLISINAGSSQSYVNPPEKMEYIVVAIESEKQRMVDTNPLLFEV